MTTTRRDFLTAAAAAGGLLGQDAPAGMWGGPVLA